ncbi:MAG: protein-L-isoaspartate(D-aspartate) O-methyltransferase [Pirellulaceae bacterium]|jgi:protein-L-isoaspartate(D-aspartate) O-methyltransferase|nr:protein-L-isoaspartate O-methyltransferase [Planctomycetaceae bacterium]MDP6468456.1 protein-L-isoaspartate(D-aspartate) O-methyltransferase [Pirellulaceae bacterium]MDP6556322.1 protein-L-isoaspartate(D-aspartate) O-methyltransferase [Pirellulaceae bacterium]
MKSARHLIGFVMFLVCISTTTEAIRGQRDDPFAAVRRKMVDLAVVGAGVTDRRVIQSLLDTPRHEFVERKLRSQAYFDMALPIGHQQTISSPFIVAFMTEVLETKPTDKVLEIGTGSGFQAAVLSPLVRDVYSIEIIPELGRKAERTLKRLKYDNVSTKIGDGFKGWPEHAPFDKIIVTCSPEKPPLPLIQQLREGGMMVIPVGQRYQQTLYVFRKKDGKLKAEALRPTLFVPMTGRAEDQRAVQPDPANPRAVNGNFERKPGENGFVTGWYYQRLLTWETDPVAPEGEHFVTFKNEQQGRSAHLLQGFPIDGRQVAELTVSAKMKYTNVWYPLRPDSFPSLAITFYDANRKELGMFWLGPFRGDSAWKSESKTFRVPLQTREGILRIGLFGATGELSFDDVKMTPRLR